MSFKQWLQNEAFNYSVAYKAVIMAGGPGSGKSWVSRAMFGGLGFKFSNSDEIVRVLASSLANPLFAPSNLDKNPEQKYILHNRAINITQKRSKIWQTNGIPYVIDMTGRDPGLVKKIKSELEDNGYDVYMVFVETKIDTAIARNSVRPGYNIADNDYLIDSWNKSNKNSELYRSLFENSNFIKINNDEIIDPTTKKGQETLVRLHRIALNFISKPLRNPIGIEKIKS